MFPGSPHYRLMLRNGAVRAALEHFRPDLIECQDAYNLPWAAIGYRRRHPETALVAAYMTDFPTVYVERPLSKFVTQAGRRAARRASATLIAGFSTGASTRYSRSARTAARRSFARSGSPAVDVVPLGVELGEFGPGRRDRAAAREARASTDASRCWSMSAGSTGEEARPGRRGVPAPARSARRQAGADRRGPAQGRDCGAAATIGSSCPAMSRDRAELARWLASADIYVSGMADETFGVSIVEAQASGLPVVGVAAGAMIDRVNDGVGRLGPVGDAAAMAANILAVWNGDRRAMAERGARARAPVQLGQQHGSAVRTALPGRVRQAREAPPASRPPPRRWPPDIQMPFTRAGRRINVMRLRGEWTIAFVLALSAAPCATAAAGAGQSRADARNDEAHAELRRAQIRNDDPRHRRRPAP